MWMIHKEDLLFEMKRECRQQVIKRAAVDLTIEENVLKKILQEKKIMSDARNCVERKQLMLRDKKTLY